MGMGAAALVLERADAAGERGLRPICEVLAAVTANSTFHGTRLDVQHIHNVMESLVRQAEVLAAVRETYNIPRDANLRLRDFPTLARVIQFVYDRRPDLKAVVPAPAAAPVQATAPPVEDSVRQNVLDLIAQKTGYPKTCWIWISISRRTWVSNAILKQDDSQAGIGLQMAGSQFKRA